MANKYEIVPVPTRILTIHDDIVEARGDGPRVLDESVSEYMQKINSNPLFIAYRTG